jgi:hypothetical protein
MRCSIQALKIHFGLLRVSKAGWWYSFTLLLLAHSGLALPRLVLRDWALSVQRRVVACLEHVILLATELLTHIGTRALALFLLVVFIQYRPLWNA